MSVGQLLFLYRSATLSDVFRFGAGFREGLNNVGEAVRARQKTAKKRSLLVVNEHFEPIFNAALATQVIIQRFLKIMYSIYRSQLA